MRITLLTVAITAFFLCGISAAFAQLEVPAIKASPASGYISGCIGSPSPDPYLQQFTVSGSYLSSPVTVTAPAGFELSLNADAGFGSSEVLTPLAGGIGSTPVYVRSAAGDEVGKITGVVVLTSPGVPAQNVNVSGKVNALPTVNTVTDQTFADGEVTPVINFIGTGNTFTWITSNPSIGLARGGTGAI